MDDRYDPDYEEPEFFEEWEDDWELNEVQQEAIKIMEEEEMEGDKDIPTISDKYWSTDSDIDIISSDGICFMVHTFALKRAW